MPGAHCVVTPSPQNGSVVPTTLTALTIVLLAIVPGFVATTMWERSRTLKGHDSYFRTMLLSVAISGVIHVVSAPLTILWIVRARGDPIRHSYPVAGWAALVVLVIPTAMGIDAARFSDWFQEPKLRQRDQEPSMKSVTVGCGARVEAAGKVAVCLRSGSARRPSRRSQSISGSR